MKRTIISVSVIMCFACAAHAVSVGDDYTMPYSFGPVATGSDVRVPYKTEEMLQYEERVYNTTPENVNTPIGWDTQIQWSYGALADTMWAMRENCEKTDKTEFLQIGDWARAKNAKFSLRELVIQCISPSHTFHEIDRTIKNCNLSSELCAGNQCVENSYTDALMGTKNSGCDVYISALIANHESNRTARGGVNKPGTYVTCRHRNAGGGCDAYEVSDVVLPNDYYIKNKMNRDVVLDAANTVIYEIKGGTAIDTGLRTCSADMFLNVLSTASKQGSVFGAFVGAYILPGVDMTTEIYSLYDENRGRVSNVVSNIRNSLDYRDYDIKQTYKPKLLAALNEYGLAQNRTGTIIGDMRADSNDNVIGVMFNGCVANMEWLGHMLYGMNREETIMPNGWADWLVKAVNRDKEEPETLDVAANYGGALVLANREKRDYTFKDIQTKRETDAYDMARANMLSRPGVVAPVTCRGNCNPIPNSNDIVICTDANGQRIEYVFNDICNRIFAKGIEVQKSKDQVVVDVIDGAAFVGGKGVEKVAPKYKDNWDKVESVTMGINTVVKTIQK